MCYLLTHKVDNNISVCFAYYLPIFLIYYFLWSKGLQEVGLFRVPGASAEVDELKICFEKGKGLYNLFLRKPLFWEYWVFIFFFVCARDPFFLVLWNPFWQQQLTHTKKPDNKFKRKNTIETEETLFFFANSKNNLSFLGVVSGLS